MIFYHISNKNNLNKIVKTDSPEGENFLRPTILQWLLDLPEDALYKEPKDPPRICVAPSVWQCVSGLGKAYGDGIPTGLVYVYEIIIDEVEERTFNSSETVITDEKWITDSIIKDEIGISLVAFMDIEKIFVSMKNFTVSETLDQMKALNEWEDVWSKSGETNEIKLKKEELKGRFT